MFLPDMDQSLYIGRKAAIYCAALILFETHIKQNMSPFTLHASQFRDPAEIFIFPIQKLHLCIGNQFCARLNTYLSTLQAVERMSIERQRQLLFFWTSVKYLPSDGFCGLSSKLYIYKTSDSPDRLPSSQTCFYRLCLPPYTSMKMMENQLQKITQEHVSCSFGAW